MTPAKLYPVILSGGAGTRLWPLSRSSRPKQLLALAGDHTMIQATVLRAAVPDTAAPIIVCSEDHRFIVAEQMREIDIVPTAIVLEPMGRNTAPAAAIAALIVAAEDPEGVVLLMPSDHVVREEDAFRTALQSAAAAARKGLIVSFGIEPTGPETGYGYIQRGAAIPGLDGVFRTRRFAEKPDFETAREFIKDGSYSWNSGMFIFRADVLLAELGRFDPSLVAYCREALETSEGGSDFTRLGAAAFAQATNISVDYALMEKTDKAAVVPCALGWSDVGAWSSLWDIKERDAAGNAFQGDVYSHDTQNSFVHSEKGLTVLVGVHDLVVVVTEDAVLVSDRARSQDVKVIVDNLKSAKRKEASEHKIVERPWGTYQSIDEGGGFQVKEIVVKPGGRLSLQMHYKRAEHWIVVQGSARVTRDNEVFTLSENEATYIPLGAKHRLENLGAAPLRLIEVQCGAYLGEDDIVRFDDMYGRVNK